VGVPKVGLEHVDRVAQLLGPGCDLAPEFALPEQATAGAAIGFQVGPGKQPDRGADRSAAGMLVEQRAKQRRAGVRASRNADVADPLWPGA
jgi:hypothetical protein